MKKCKHCGWESSKNTTNFSVHTAKNCIGRLEADRDDWRAVASFRAGLFMGMSHKFHNILHKGEMSECDNEYCVQAMLIMDNFKESIEREKEEYGSSVSEGSSGPQNSN